MLSFIGLDQLLNAWNDERILYLAGGKGTGKTLLALGLSYELHRRGVVRHSTGNIPFSWMTLDRPATDCFWLIDEGGRFFDNRSFGTKANNDMRKALLYGPRKLNYWFAIASAIPPDSSMAALTIQRRFAIGDLSNYAWWYDGGAKDVGGTLWVLGLSSLYSYYSTLSAPSAYDTESIARAIKRGLDDLEDTSEAHWSAGASAGAASAIFC